MHIFIFILILQYFVIMMSKRKNVLYDSTRSIRYVGNYFEPYVNTNLW